MARVVVSSAWRTVLAMPSTLNYEGASLRVVIEALMADFPGLRARVFTNAGSVAAYVNVYIDGEDIRNLASLDSACEPQSEVMIIPAFAGG